MSNTNFCQGCGNEEINSHTREYSGWTFCNNECAETFKDEINRAIPVMLREIENE